MLTRDTNRRHKGVGKPGSKSDTMRSNPIIYPEEVREKYGDLPLFTSGGHIYAKLNGRSPSVARLIYSLHNPDYDFSSNQKVYHIDNDPRNNRIENLTLIREEAQGV